MQNKFGFVVKTKYCLFGCDLLDHLVIVGLCYLSCGNVTDFGCVDLGCYIDILVELYLGGDLCLILETRVYLEEALAL